MKRAKLRLLIIRLCLVAVLAAGIIWLIVYLTTKNQETKITEETVSFGNLYSTISSAGNVSQISAQTPVPVAAYIYGIDSLDDIDETELQINWASILFSDERKPVAYCVSKVESVISNGSFSVNGNTPETNLVTLVPVYFNTQKFRERYEEAKEQDPSLADQGLLNYLFYLLFEENVGNINVSKIPKEFLSEKTSEAKTVTTSFTNLLMEDQVAYGIDIEYKLSRVTYHEGDYLTLGSTIFNINYRQLFVLYTVSEYDFADIDARMRKNESVYAAISVNALGGRMCLTEVIEIAGSSSTSGVSYYKLKAKLIFPNLSGVTEEDPYEDYTYYDEDLTNDYVKGLGINLKDYLKPEEVINNYSVTVTSQKEAIYETLIVSTKSIFYDGSKKPYVIRLDDKNKEKRVYIKIVLSTGKEAAVTPLEGNSLTEGDRVRYNGDSSLISSLF